MAKDALYYFKAISFTWILLGCSFAINLIQFWGLFLAFVSRSLYRTFMRFTQRLFGSLLIVLTFIYAPLEINLTGCHTHLKQTSFVPIMANHQIYTDWWYVWLFSWFRESHGELKIILKESLKNIPILGWGMQCFEFIFFARKWPIDSKRLQKTLTYAKNDNNPMWLLVFPEGTVITQDTQEKSRAFAKKNDITEDPKHVLLPKSTGLYHILRQMQKSSDYLYDFTIGYSGITENHCPYDEYPPTKVFFEHQGPKSIHIHVDRFKITEIPGIPSTSYDINEATPKEFELWLRRRFMEKDELMKGFYEDGYFPEKSVDGTGVKQSLHLNPANQDWISITGLVATSVMSLGWLFL